MYKVILTRQALKDLEKLKRAGYSKNAKELTDLVALNPYQSPPRCEKLTGDLRGFYSRRINDQHRYTYQVLPNTENLLDANNKPYAGIVKVIRMWTHYE